MTQLPDPVLEFAFEVRVHVDPPLRVGGTSPREALHVVPITGGTVDGPRLRGEVLPGGEDWYVDRDGVITLDAAMDASTSPHDLMVELRRLGLVA